MSERRCAPAVLALLALLLSLAPLRGVVGQGSTSADVITGQTLRLLLSAIPWDSLCGAGCGTVAVDTVIVYAPAPGTYPNSASNYHVYHVIAGQERRAARAIPFPVVWTGHAGGHPGDTTDVVITREVVATRQDPLPERAAERFFLNVLRSHDAFVEAYIVRLERRGEQWVLIREGHSEG